jgi:hypothetical protein
MATSQLKQVLEHLKEHGSITSYEAFKLYGATRLSAIIHTLRHREGYNIVSHYERVTTRNGFQTTIAVYKLEGEGD